MIPILHPWSVNTNSYLHVTYRVEANASIRSAVVVRKKWLLSNNTSGFSIKSLCTAVYCTNARNFLSVNEKGSFDSLCLHLLHIIFYIIHYRRILLYKADSSMLLIQTRGRKLKVSQAATIMLIRLILLCLLSPWYTVWSCLCLGAQHHVRLS